ncbi:MAG: spermidine synthase [bacterium]
MAIVIERASTPNGEIQLQKLSQRDSEGNSIYEIVFNGIFLMATYSHRSSEALATLAIEPIAKSRGRIDVLIGGLGMGYTLRSALSYPQVSRVDVVEIEEKIIEWNRKFFHTHNRRALLDPRTRVIRGDLCEYVDKAVNKYDAVAVDIDNGPARMVLEGNRRLYTPEGLAKLKGIVNPGGAVALWSQDEDEGLRRAMEGVFENVEIIGIEEDAWMGRVLKNYIYRAIKGGGKDGVERRYNRGWRGQQGPRP